MAETRTKKYGKSSLFQVEQFSPQKDKLCFQLQHVKKKLQKLLALQIGGVSWGHTNGHYK